jgi:hypothetical protein
MRNRVQAAQKHPVGINITINLPNERVGKYMEIPWGTWKNQNIDLLDVLDEFVKQDLYPEIGEIILDYPYTFVAGHIHRLMDTGTADPDLCGAGVTCQRISPRAAFRGRIEMLWAAMAKIRGAPRLSFFINSGERGVAPCIQAGLQPPYILPYYDNKCLDTKYPLAQENGSGASATQANIDADFVEESRRYYNLVKSGLPSEIKVHSMYLLSWLENPRFNNVYARQVADIVRANSK